MKHVCTFRGLYDVNDDSAICMEVKIRVNDEIDIKPEHVGLKVYIKGIDEPDFCYKRVDMKRPKVLK